MSSHEASNTPTFKQQELSGWDAKAKNYDAYAGSITRQAVAPLLAASNVKKGTKLLDIATGPGYVAGSAFAQGATVIGVDFAPGMVAEAKKNFPNIDFRQGDAEALEFEDNSFDVVTCAFGLLHLADPDKGIAEAFRVIRPGGCFTFTVWSSPEKHDFFRLVLNAIESYGTLDNSLPQAPSIFRFSEPKECEITLMNAGFIDIDVMEIPLYWEPNTPKDLLSFLERSSVRMAMLLENQTAEALTRIHQAILENAQQFKRGKNYRIAWPAVMVVAKKP